MLSRWGSYFEEYVNASSMYRCLICIQVLGIANFSTLLGLAEGGSSGSFYNTSGGFLPLRFYLGYLGFNIVVLSSCLVWRTRILSHFSAVENWLRKRQFRRWRYVIFGVVSLIIVSYSLKLHFGFYFHGIAGWVEPSYGLYHCCEGVTKNHRAPSFLRKSISAKNIKYVPEPMRLRSYERAMFLHFGDGQDFPANFDLTGFVFDDYIFDRDDTSIMFDILCRGLERRRSGTVVVLPDFLAYPNHSPYRKIDYRGYPSCDSLTKISFWEVVIDVDPESGEFEVIDGHLVREIAR